MSDIDPFAGANIVSLFFILAAVFWQVSLLVLAAIGAVSFRYRHRTAGKMGMIFVLIVPLGMAWLFAGPAVEKAWHSADGVVDESFAKSRIALEDVLGMPLLRSKEERMKAKLTYSPPGAECMKIIGQDCQCGPFLLQQRNGEILANHAYVILAGEREISGCTDAEGMTQAIEIKHTGRQCGVRRWTKSDAPIRCAES
jgi:hypothetical protein